jgi:hypothetical protein
MVSEANQPFITDHPNEVRLRDVIQALILNPDHRARGGRGQPARRGPNSTKA